ncbi:MAG: Lar family restriction alleviation protein [Spirochaetes bacterium]|nr:Lar family restriction alleviation protein [Spirochaetota bacterium]
MKEHALCPFCSGPAKVTASGGGEYMAGDFAVECKTCGARGPYRSTAGKAWAEWDGLFGDDAEDADNPYLLHGDELQRAENARQRI